MTTEISKINESLSNIKDQIVRKTAPKLARDKYNCWGFTARLLGWTKTMRWINRDEMVGLLIRSSVAVMFPKEGDVAVFMDSDGRMTHTAVITEVLETGDRVFVHKPGYRLLEMITEKDAIKGYPEYGSIVEYRRTCLL
jgi:hypothetical protein